MGRCSNCGAVASDVQMTGMLTSLCPDCIRVKKHFKSQSNPMGGSSGGGGGFFSSIFALTVGLVQLFAALSVLMFKIYAVIFKKSASIAVKGAKAAKYYNDENPNSILTKKWSERSKGYKIFYISVITLSVTIFFIAISASNDDAKTRVSFDNEAVAAGFVSREEQVAAEQAGFKDKPSYAKHLAEVEAKKKAAELAAQERKSIETARASEAENDQNSGSANDPILKDGRRLSEWKKLCAAYSVAITACSTRSEKYEDLMICIRSRMGGVEIEPPLTECEDDNPPAHLFP